MPLSVGLFFFVVGVFELAISGFVLAQNNRERRRLEDLRYGVQGRAFSERDRDAATSRLRDRRPW